MRKGFFYSTLTLLFSSLLTYGFTPVSLSNLYIDSNTSTQEYNGSLSYNPTTSKSLIVEVIESKTENKKKKSSSKVKAFFSKIQNIEIQILNNYFVSSLKTLNFTDAVRVFVQGFCLSPPL